MQKSRPPIKRNHLHPIVQWRTIFSIGIKDIFPKFKDLYGSLYNRYRKIGKIEKLNLDFMHSLV